MPYGQDDDKPYEVGYCKPPRNKVFTVGNKLRQGKGRKPGPVVAQFYRFMAEMTLDEVEKIARSRDVCLAKRRAAQDWIRAVQYPDMADYTPVLQGRETLDDARKRGIDTTSVKQMAVSRSENGDAVRITLDNRSDSAIERILDRAVGKARIEMQVESAVAVGVEIKLVDSETMKSVIDVDERGNPTQIGHTPTD